MRIMLVIDYSNRSERIVREVAERPWPAGTIVRVLAIAPTIPPSAAELWFDAGGSLEQVIRMRIERSEELAAGVAEVLRGKGLTVEISVRAGRVRRAMKDEAKEWQADLVIPGRGFRRFTPPNVPSLRP